MQPMTILIPTKIIFGVESHSKIPEEVRGLGGEAVFLVTDKGVAQTDFFKKVIDLLQASKIGVEIFDDVESDPSDKTVEKAFNLFQKRKATVLLAIGGGSPIDTAKAVGILATNGGRIHDYEAIDRRKGRGDSKDSSTGFPGKLQPSESPLHHRGGFCKTLS
jgi:alcohol dehydrogenase